MTPAELDTLEALAKAATNGPWLNLDAPYWGEIHVGGDERGLDTPHCWDLICVMPEADDRTADFNFIAASREAVPALIAEVRRLQAVVDAAVAFVHQPGSANYVRHEDAPLYKLHRAVDKWEEGK